MLEQNNIILNDLVDFYYILALTPSGLTVLSGQHLSKLQLLSSICTKFVDGLILSLRNYNIQPL